MVGIGDRLSWEASLIADKHSVGGLPGNRTTPIVVAIVAALGLTIPKTSSRAITSPAGTADTMETLAPVDLDVAGIRRVVEQESGCIVWGGALRLSPADDILIRIERVLDLDSEGQLIASVLSKKIAAGASHVVLDIPVGPTAKVRSAASAEVLSRSFHPGEVVTSAVFARLLSIGIDWLVTVDPHLHRYLKLEAIYPVTAVAALNQPGPNQSEPVQTVGACGTLLGILRGSMPERSALTESISTA